MSNIQDKLEKAEDRAKKRDEKDFPESWKPTEAGEKLFGEVMEINPGFGKSEDLLFWTIREKNGKEWSVLETSALSSARVRDEIKVGDTVGISFRGMGKTKAGRDFKKYVVVKE